MCGILGFIGGPKDEHSVRTEVGALGKLLRHRGPDSEGEWVDADAGVALGHRRLSILDLSAEGHQPMLSRGGRYVLSYNGEVYNYQELAEQLRAKGHAFRGHSDTEVILAGVEEWGLEETLRRSNGMFALALWDREKRELTLARDRLGIKPLFYAWAQGRFIFSSELRVISAATKGRLEIDQQQLALMLRYNYVPAPMSIYRDVFKLLPGSVLRLGLSQCTTIPQGYDPENQPERYWSLADKIKKSQGARFEGTYKEAILKAESLLKDAVSIRMISDVPLGGFLSGGIDSSLVVALMQASSSKPVKTFSIGFNESSYNEAVHAKAVAEHLGTDHTELYLSATEAASAVPLLGGMYDEPFADSSQLPTYLVSKLARESVTVSLSGDGGDELFYGYHRYSDTENLWRKINLLPYGFRKVIAAALRVLPLTSAQRTYDRLFQPGADSRKYRNPFFMAFQLAEVLDARRERDVYDLYMTHWLANKKLMREPVAELAVLPKHSAWDESENSARAMMLIDALTYLPDDILTKVDRASMAVSLEARVPIIDYRFVEFAWSLPDQYRYSAGNSKRLLKDILYNYVPQSLLERPKMGFGVPIGAWLRTDLRDWAEDLLSEKRLKEDGLLNVRYVREHWEAHLANHSHAQSFLWNVLMFQAWKQDRKGTVPC